MDRCTTSKIETSHLVGPSRRIPGPAGDWVVNDGGPDKHEYDAGKHATSLGDSTSCESHGDGREHALVDCEEQIRDLCGTHRRLAQYILKPKVGQVSNIGGRRVRKSQRVTPKEPLERRDGCRHNGEPYQG